MRRRWLAAAMLCALSVIVMAQVQMPDPKQISGVPLPAADLPVGSVSVRVIRGSFANNLAGVDVDFVVDGKPTRMTTDDAGRVQIAGVRVGARVKAVAVVAGERLESQETTIAESGIRFVLAATDPDAAAREAEDRRLAAGPATRGSVVLGPGSRIVAEFSDDKLWVFYVMSVLNTARTPVDIGGPLTFELPQGARAVGLVEESSPQASANGPRVVVTGPFQPGTTRVNIRFELPYSGPTARIEQRWPAALQQLEMFALKIGEMGIESPQLASVQSTVQEGQPLIVASGPGVAAGAPMTIDVTGLPHHPRWPRFVALAVAGTLVTVGLWAAFSPSSRRSRARTA